MSRPRIALVMLALMGALLLVGACGSTDKGSAPAGTSEATRDVAAFAASMGEPGTVVLDVRTPQEFAQGHIAGAVNVDVESPDFATRIAKRDKNVPYAVYCRSGRRSGIALELMVRQGFTTVYHLDGGITAWQEAGKPVSR